MNKEIQEERKIKEHEKRKTRRVLHKTAEDFFPQIGVFLQI